MNNTQQLFELNKRINQIKRNLQSRQQKAQQWSVPYERILQNSPSLAQNSHIFSKTFQSNFRNSHNQNVSPHEDRMATTILTKTERKQFYEGKVKQSRKKINQYHNQLKQLQQLLQKRTKLHVKRQNKKESVIQNFTRFDKKPVSLSVQNKNMGKTFTNSMLLMGILCKNSSKNSVRSLKDRPNPFSGLKVQKMIELYQEAKIPGKQNFLNHTLGIGIQFTPYSNLKKQPRRGQQIKNLQKSQIFTQKQSEKNQSQEQECPGEDEAFKCVRNLPRVLGSKIQDRTDIYIDFANKKQNICQDLSPQLFRKKKDNIFELRMKRILKETSKFQTCNGNYLQMIKRRGKNKTMSGFDHSPIGKVKANNTYKTIFQSN